MEKSFASNITNFSVHILTKNIAAGENLYVELYPVEEYVIILTNINIIYPNWSYILKKNKKTNSSNYRVLNSIGKGS